MELLIRNYVQDPEAMRDSCLRPKRGLHAFFRLSNASMREQFTQLVDAGAIPTAFVHGNPHLDNYAKTTRGAAMVDFDRARYGPYAYDLIRFAVSLSIRRAAQDHRLLHPLVLASLQRGYVFGASVLDYEGAAELEHKRPKKWQSSVRAYMKAGRDWARRLRQHAIDRDDPRLPALLESYAISRNEPELVERFRIKAAGEVAGSMGKLHLVMLLDPRDCDADLRLVDIKETYDEPDEEHFFNPFAHNGRRMVEAGRVHAPGWEIAPGWASLGDHQYWCRGLPTQKIKLKTTLEEVEQADVAFAVGSQLGRAHRISMPQLLRDEHLEHFASNFEHWMEVAHQLRRDVELAHGIYVRDLERGRPEGWARLGESA